MYRLLLVLVPILILLSGCGSAPAESVAQPTNTAPPTLPPTSEAAVSIPMDTVVPTEPASSPTEEATLEAQITTEAVETSEATPQVPTDDLRAKWQSPLLVSVLMFGLCEQAQKTEANPFAITIFLGVMQEGLNKWKPTEDQAEVNTALREQIKTIADAITQKEDVDSALEEACGQAEDTLQDIRTRANADGMSDEELEKIIKEYQEQLKEAN